jgi:predicted DsbA family dithiol-disulfide isomerase
MNEETTASPVALTQKEVVAQVVAKAKSAAKAAPVAKPAPPAPAAAAPAASLASSAAKEEKASQEKVKEMAQKLGIPFTSDLTALGSNSAISDALIEKAVAAGKSEAQINEAMSAL